MRRLIIVKSDGAAVANREVSDPETEQTVIDTLKATYPGKDYQWFKHTCNEEGCIETVFTLEAVELPKEETKTGIIVHPQPISKSKKKKSK